MPSAPRRLLMWSEGSLGEAVIQRLAEAKIPPAAARTPIEAEPLSAEAVGGILEESRAEVVGVAAAGRQFPSFLKALNTAAWRRGIAWTVGVVEETVIGIGPSVVPKKTACYECFRRRYLTHSPNRRAEIPLERFFDENAGAGFRGRLASLDSLAASLIAMEIARLVRGEPARSQGAWWYLDPLTGEQGCHAISPVPWCGTCSPVTDPLEWSSAALGEGLRKIFRGDSGHVQG